MTQLVAGFTAREEVLQPGEGAFRPAGALTHLAVEGRKLFVQPQNGVARFQQLLDIGGQFDHLLLGLCRLLKILLGACVPALHDRIQAGVGVVEHVQRGQLSVLFLAQALLIILHRHQRLQRGYQGVVVAGEAGLDLFEAVAVRCDRAVEAFHALQRWPGVLR